MLGGVRDALEATLGALFPDLLVDDLLQLLGPPQARPAAGWT